MRSQLLGLASLFFTVTTFAADLPGTKLLDCHSNGGGYVVQDLKVQRVGNELVFDLQRFSPVPEIVPDMGLRIEGKLAKQATIHFPASLCLVKAAPAPQAALVACSSGITKVPVTLTLLDGTTTTLTLPDNFTIEIQQQDTHSVFETRSGTLIQAFLSSASENTLGFRARECR